MGKLNRTANQSEQGGVLVELSFVLVFLFLLLPLLMDAGQRMNNQLWLGQVSFLAGWSAGEVPVTQRKSQMNNTAHRLLDLNRQLRKFSYEGMPQFVAPDEIKADATDQDFKSQYISRASEGTYKDLLQGNMKSLRAALEGPILTSSPGIVPSFDAPSNITVGQERNYIVYRGCCGNPVTTPETRCFKDDGSPLYAC
jgi:hypothetical protein